MLLAFTLAASGCFTKQAREDQTQVNQVCEENSIVIECRIAQAWLTMSKTTSGVAEFVELSKGTDKEAQAKIVGQTYKEGLTPAKAALEAAQVYAATKRADNAFLKLKEAYGFLEVWKAYKKED